MGESLGNLESADPNASTIDVLTQIWQGVLQRSRIGPNDRLLDLGCDDSLADKAFAEMARAFNRPLPTATIFHAPTIAALASLLESPALPRFSPFVKLKGGIETTPILIAPGLGGRSSFSGLAKQIRTEHAIYGIQAKGVDGMEEPLERIEDMAAFYLESLREIQPLGPYSIVGYSFGGLIALEMAQRLVAEGKTVALLVLVDTYPHPRYLSLGQRVQLMGKRIKSHVSDLAQKPFGIACSEVHRALKRRLHIAETDEPGGPSSANSGLSLTKATLRVKGSDFSAMKRYRPRFYRGKIRFVRPETNSYLPTDPSPFWRKLAEDFEVETVAGDHLSMVSARSERLAAILTRYATEAATE
jgi:acetoacetyl-CoA synthetase